jgi:hypothetical protein
LPDPDYDLSVEWKATHDCLLAAEKRQKDPQTRSRVLLIIGAARNDGSCPGEISKTYRMSLWAKEALAEADIEADVLDLSLLTSGYDLHIHPCRLRLHRHAAMPLVLQLLSESTVHARPMTGWRKFTRSGWRRTASSS